MRKEREDMILFKVFGSLFMIALSIKLLGEKYCRPAYATSTARRK